jgi:hypothetical protein
VPEAASVHIIERSRVKLERDLREWVFDGALGCSPAWDFPAQRLDQLAKRCNATSLRQAH